MTDSPDQPAVAKKPGAWARKRARRLALQAIYQWQMNAAPVAEIEAQFRTDNDLKKVDVDYFHELLTGVVEHCEDLDAAYAGFLDRGIERLTPVEQAVLRLGAFEMLHRIDVPWRVVISESVELSRQFGSTDGHKFVNGVLDKLGRSARALEAGSPPG